MIPTPRIVLIALLTLAALTALSFSSLLPSVLHAQAVNVTPEERSTVSLAATIHPTATPKPPSHVRLPILMYHYISSPPLGSDKYRIDLSVPPDHFEAQLQYLRDHGFTTVGLQDVYDLLSTGKPLPPKPIVLTFDDGYRDHYENAFPLLQKYGMTGTFFIVTDFIVYGNPEHVTWPMVQTMVKGGMDIQSHSRTHKDMRNRSNAFLVWEILGPAEQIGAYAGKKPLFFCYPSGHYDNAVIKVLRDIGTLASVTTDYGDTYSLTNAMLWPRLRVHNTTTIAQFAALVSVSN